MPFLAVHNLPLGGGPPLSFETSATRLLLLGAPTDLSRGLFDAATRTKGSIRIGDRSLAESRLSRAPRIGAFPPRWTAVDWLAWRVQLEAPSVSKSEARQRASRALEGFDLAGYAHEELRLAPALLTRALPLLGALAAAAPESVIVFDDVFTGLDDALANGLAERFVHALEARRGPEAGTSGAWIGFLPRLTPDSALFTMVEEVFVFAGNEVLARGTPNEVARATSTTYVVRVLGTDTAWTERLAGSGVHLHRERPFERGTAPGKELLVSFEQASDQHTLFTVALESADAIVELFPAAGKLV